MFRSRPAAGTSGYTPLHYAARGGHIAAVQLLLQHGVCRLASRTTTFHIARRPQGENVHMRGLRAQVLLWMRARVKARQHPCIEQPRRITWMLSKRCE